MSTIQQEKTQLDEDLLTIVDEIQNIEEDYYKDNGKYKTILHLENELQGAVPDSMKTYCQVHSYNNSKIGHGYVILITKELPEYNIFIQKGIGTGPEDRTKDWREFPLM